MKRVKVKVKVICNNQTALYNASNPIFHERTKHKQVKCHFIQGDTIVDFTLM